MHLYWHCYGVSRELALILGGEDEKRQLMWEWVMDGDDSEREKERGEDDSGDLDQRMRRSKRVVRCLPSSMI